MNSIVGEFHMEEIDEKQYFVYHLNKSDISHQTLFVCPFVRLEPFGERCKNLSGEIDIIYINIGEINSSPYFNQENESSDDYSEKERLAFVKNHYVLPLFWCKNKDDCDDDNDDDGYNSCQICGRNLKIGTDYYFCVTCDYIFHKECVEFPPEIKHPYDPNHLLKFSYSQNDVECGPCKIKDRETWVYQCSLCNMSLDNICALKPIPFVMEKTKRHDHFLTFFTRKDPLRCNVCGLINKTHPTYVCLKCNFVVHKDCADFPSVIRISRHHHRINFVSSLPPRKWSCGVCRQNVDGEYGAYSCKKCDGYVVHSRCALRKDIWDGKELDGIPEDDDIEEVLEPFKILSDGLILHFLHKHALKAQTRGEIYDESEICHACVLPIYEGEFYSCIECDFILHDLCANAPRKKRHPLHPHPLTLKITSEYNDRGYFRCNICWCWSSGFIYECNIKEKCFRLDVRCGSISEPLIYQGHEHPLFLALDPQERYLCQICQQVNIYLINCIECDFIICLKCVTVPYMVRYKHDNHFLTLVHEKETKDPNWCEVCEKLLISEEEGEVDKRYYQCNQCCTTLHIKCLLGKMPYMKPGHTISGNIQILFNNSLSRPFCFPCWKRCVDKIIYKKSNNIACSIYHIDEFNPVT